MKKLLHAFSLAAIAALLAWSPAASALDLVGEDTDLFLTNPAISSEIPNVLIILDNTSNWSAANQGWSSSDIANDSVCGTGTGGAGMNGTKQGDAELCAIYKVAATLTDIVNVGLMMINDQDAGGYIMFPIKSMNATNRSALQTKVKTIATTGISSNNYKTSANNTMENVMNDAFRYFNSFATYGGTGAASAEADVSAYGSSAKTNFSLTKPTNSCGYDYIILIGNGWPSGNQSSSQLSTTMNAAAALLNDSANVTPNVTPTGAACKGGSCNQSDAWSRFLYNFGTKVAAGSYRHITTYTVDVCKDQCDTNQAQLLNSMATLSYGRYFKATSLSAIVTALSTIFVQVQAVNSVFAATTLPVSINVRGTNLNQVYIGVFRPDSQLSPRWMGNLKMYKLGVANSSTGQLQLIDADSNAAINLNTGFVANTAKSFWSSSSSFWSFRSPFKPTDAGGASDLPDGDLVEKGGAAQRIREQYPNPDSTVAMTRNVYTCTGLCLTTTGSALSGTLFNADNADITSTDLGTFPTVNISSITASGGVATATSSTNHGFVTNDSVTISGAVPDLYNGTYAITKLTDTTFSYTPSSSPNTTHAYVTFNDTASNILTAGSDVLTVDAAGTDYDITSATVAAVAGQTRQVSYALAGTAPSSAATGYTVTAKRLISNSANNSNLQWNSSAASTANVTVTRANHGYSSGDVVTISGVKAADGTTDQTGLNGSFAITKVSDSVFTYAASATPSGGTTQTGIVTMTSGIPSGWGNGTVVAISGATAPETGYNTTSATLTNVNSTAGTFEYTTASAVGANATGTITAARVVASDTSTWTVSSASLGGSGNNKYILMVLSRGKYSGQQLHTLAAGDAVTINNCSYNLGSGGNAADYSCNGLVIPTGTTPAGVSGSTSTTSTTVAADTYANLSATNVTIRLQLSSGVAGFNSVTVVTTAQGATPATNATTVTRTASTTGSSFAVTGIARGAATVNAYGTVYAQKTGDLTSKVTAITTQAVSTGTITAGLSTVSDPNERENLINWVRGKDNKDNEDNDSISTDIRASVHGDVLHSRPAVINYNRNGDDNDVYIFYGANDGLFHAVKGGFGTDGGNEQWAFVPKEHFSKLKRLRNQSQTISSTNPRQYFFDGPIGAYTKDVDSNNKLQGSVAGNLDKVYLYVGMRRGGRYYYALDVSNPTNPKFLWRKGCPNATGTTGCDTGWAELGQTWSEPKLGYVRAYGNSRLVMFFGAGYDSPAEDLQPCGVTAWTNTSVTGKSGVVFPNQMTAANCGTNFTTGTAAAKSRTMGRGIYMVDALTGDVLWRAVPSATATADPIATATTVSPSGMDFAISADVSVLKHRSNTAGRGSTGTESVTTGYLDRLYAVDLGGQVWRVDMSDASVSNWVVNKFAKVTPSDGTADTPPTKNMRKFMFQADVVYSSDANGDYDAVLVGSGDREHPFDQTVENRFYMFKDRNTGTITPAMMASASPPTTITESNLTDVTDNCLQSASFCTGSNTQTSVAESLKNNKGWMLKFSNSGEKTIAPGTTSAGTVIFNTNQPVQDTVSGTAVNVGANAGNFCTSDLGTARQYGIDYQDATSNNIFTALPSQFQSSSGRFATFSGGGFLPAPVPVVVQIDGKYYQTVIAGVQATNPGGLTLQTRVRSYWYNKTN